MSSTSCDCCDNSNNVGIPGLISDLNGSDLPLDINPELAVKVNGVLTVNEKCLYPAVRHIKLDAMFQEMVEILNNNLFDYEENMLSFWLLDMFIEGLKTAQDSGMSHKHQKITLLWIAFMFNYILQNNVSRTETFKYLFSLILPVPHSEHVMIGEYDGEYEKLIDINKALLDQSTQDKWEIPLPPDIKESEMSSADSFASENQGEDTEAILMERNVSINKNISHMTIILEILYRIFSRFWVFKALQIAFHETPTANIVDLPFTLNTPKPIFMQEAMTSVKSGKAQKKQLDEEMESAPQTNNFIVPLQLADGAKTYARQLFNIPSKETIPASTKKSKK